MERRARMVYITHFCHHWLGTPLPEGCLAEAANARAAAPSSSFSAMPVAVVFGVAACAATPVRTG